MTIVIHPAADEIGPDYLVYDATARHVPATEPLRVFLRAATDASLHPVLLTHADARLSAHLLLALADASGYWAVRTDDGAYCGFTGRRLGAFADLWRGPARSHPAFLAATAPDRTVIAYDVYTAARAETNTQVGRTAQTMTTTLGGTPLDRWGPAEPLLAAWDPSAITAEARAQMPTTPALLASGPDYSFAQTRVGRARHGLVEQTTGGVCTSTARPADPVALAGQALVAVADTTNVTLGLIWLTARHDQASLRPAPRPADRPLAVIVGPRAVRDLGADLDDLATRHDTQRLGRARTPALLVRFSAPDTEAWLQLLQLAADLGPTEIARASTRPTRPAPATAGPAGPTGQTSNTDRPDQDPTSAS